jgi:hypothetical protein
MGRKNRIVERGIPVAMRKRKRKKRTKMLIPTLVHPRKVARADM